MYSSVVVYWIHFENVHYLIPGFPTVVVVGGGGGEGGGMGGHPTIVACF